MNTTLNVSIKFISNIINSYNFPNATKPLFIGVNGPQGSGKTYLTLNLTNKLQLQYSNLNIISFSIDDFYLTYDDQSKLTQLAKLDGNKLLQGRGLPGTHDLSLLNTLLEKLVENYKNNKWETVHLPFYDKSLHEGLGDRSEKDKISLDKPIDVILFEGWFNGFMPLDFDQLRLNYFTQTPSSILQQHPLHFVEDINKKLIQYVKVWKYCQYFIIIKSDSIENVYKWRLEQEHELIKLKGIGMSDDQVVKFVNRYMPIYILYYGNLVANGSDFVKENLILNIGINRNLLSYRTIETNT
ncbi:uncharacterized protein KGF55_003881 [Candida pseudojiufengensis]|uniref:uncharacterized protein n=1 Tax=Candida pseudojiufengensis TaxID=497109 RepID=UPI0022242A3F|nr:uncharacterized protein KGF55_003881 [Candida pseudojiufengensis]KAI5961910.1 hypothetical protein KGF55_003881 [Candida pseudojiufengensis]